MRCLTLNSPHIPFAHAPGAPLVHLKTRRHIRPGSEAGGLRTCHQFDVTIRPCPPKMKRSEALGWTSRDVEGAESALLEVHSAGGRGSSRRHSKRLVARLRVPRYLVSVGTPQAQEKLPPSILEVQPRAHHQDVELGTWTWTEDPHSSTLAAQTESRFLLRPARCEPTLLPSLSNSFMFF